MKIAHESKILASQDLRRELESLEAERTRISAEGEAIFDCWIAQSSPGGTARSKNPHWQLRSRIPQFGGKKSKYLRETEVAEFAAAIARGKRLRELDREIAKQQQCLSKIERLLAG